MWDGSRMLLRVIWGSWALCGVPRGELRPPTASGDPLGSFGRLRCQVQGEKRDFHEFSRFSKIFVICHGCRVGLGRPGTEASRSSERVAGGGR